MKEEEKSREAGKGSGLSVRGERGKKTRADTPSNLPTFLLPRLITPIVQRCNYLIITIPDRHPPLLR